MREKVAADTTRIPDDVERHVVNPTLELCELSWRVCPMLDGAPIESIEPGPCWTMVWRDPASQEIRTCHATDVHLLALKVVAEDLTVVAAARMGGVRPGVVETALREAAALGVLIGPKSRLRRDPSVFAADSAADEQGLAADGFTIQWHITNDCDLHCRHCYDRTKRSPLTLQQGEKVLDELSAFCAERKVPGHVSFSGGNPLLSPHFFDLYEKAAERGFSTSILGNPTSRAILERILAIQRPGFFQVSLEGLEEHNDHIRGKGFYRRVMDFLDLLGELGISPAVMLTLTRDNMDQVLPLAEVLRGKTDYFAFNRLSPVGEGAALAMPPPGRYRDFLEAYIAASESNPALGYKDNLLNALLSENGMDVCGGCTGYGCGAAFGFVAILPDGEVHACRKFPSPIGNINEQSLPEIYDSPAAETYRRGCRACDGCSLRAVCGGCLAVTSGLGLDMEYDRDPYCFFAGAPRSEGGGSPSSRQPSPVRRLPESSS